MSALNILMQSRARGSTGRPISPRPNPALHAIPLVISPPPPLAPPAPPAPPTPPAPPAPPVVILPFFEPVNDDDLAGDEPLTPSESNPAPDYPLPRFPDDLVHNEESPAGNREALPPSPRHRVTQHKRKARTMAEKLGFLMRMKDEQLTVRATARLASVQPISVRRWIKSADQMKRAAGCHRRLVGGWRHAKFPNMELSVYRSFLSFRSRGLAVPSRLLQTWSSMYMKRHHPNVDWRASIRWCMRFRGRWGLTMRVKTKVGQRLAKGEPLTRFL
ncbi:unnamed protein product [Closterium sp. NIES-53]